MLPKAQRLSTREFALVMERGAEAYAPFFVARHLPAPLFKLSPAASKKIWKTAVARNRVRRRLYAMAREILAKKQARPLLVALILKKPFDDADRAVALRSLESLFVKIGLIK